MTAGPELPCWYCEGRDGDGDSYDIRLHGSCHWACEACDERRSLHDAVAQSNKEIARLRAVIQCNSEAAESFLNDILDTKHCGLVDRGDCRDLRGISQVASRKENGGLCAVLGE